MYNEGVMKNTLKKGKIRTIIFKEGKSWYGVALELNIVESGDDPREVMLMLDEAIRGYIKSARKAKLGDVVLDQDPDPEYEKLWKNIQAKKPIKSPFQIYNSSFLMLSSLTK